MSIDWADVPVATLVRDRQDRAGVLDSFGIDYCCRGTMTLASACRERGVKLEEVRCALEASDASPTEASETDWANEPLTGLADHIVARHHTYLREQLPNVGALLDKVIAQHADNHPDLVELREVYNGLWNELVNHMMKEEQVLFPYIRLLDEVLRNGRPVPPFHCGTVRQPIQMMEDEHQSAGHALRRMRAMTAGFRPPHDACDAYRKLMNDLRSLEADLHLHIHKENNILFPRAAAAEASGQPATQEPEPSETGRVSATRASQ